MEIAAERYSEALDAAEDDYAEQVRAMARAEYRALVKAIRAAGSAADRVNSLRATCLGIPPAAAAVSDLPAIPTRYCMEGVGHLIAQIESVLNPVEPKNTRPEGWRVLRFLAAPRFPGNGGGSSRPGFNHVADDVAGVPEDLAAQLVAAGVAVDVEVDQ